MSAVPHPAPELATFLSPYPPSVIDLALSLRELVFSEAPMATELIDDACNAVAIGYSFTGRPGDGFCHIAVYARHVNLGLNHGASLADPDGVLAGAGKRVRHIAVLQDAVPDYGQLRRYVRAAIAHDRGRRPVSPVNPLAGKSVVRAIYPTKRRPAPVSE